MTSFYCKTVCDGDGAAIRAFHATRDTFDSVPEVTGHARKRFGSAILWRFDDAPEVVAQMIEVLRRSEYFRGVVEISEQDFWQSPSNGV